MSLQTFIENCISDSYSLTDSNLLRLKNSISDLKKILDDVYCNTRSKKSESRYSSVVSYELLQKVKYDNPDEFYSFCNDNVVISLVNFHGCYWIKIVNYDLNINSLSLILKSESIEYVDLFNPVNNDFEKLSELDTSKAKYLGSFQRCDFDKVVHLYHHVVNMFICDKVHTCAISLG